MSSRAYQVWCDTKLVQDGASSLALALHNAYLAATGSRDGVADVYQGSRFVATVDSRSPEPQESSSCAA